MQDYIAAELNQQVHVHDRLGSGSNTLESSLEETTWTLWQERLVGRVLYDNLSSKCGATCRAILVEPPACNESSYPRMYRGRGGQ